MITVLAGGVGAARFLQGLTSVMPPSEITVISNTGDDLELFGLHISPDTDIVLYHLAGLADEKRGWGISHDTFKTVDALGRFGYPTWFRLGDRDLATVIHRSALMSQGRTLSQATAQLAKAFGIECRIIPMCDEFVPTMVETDEGLLEFQRYFVERQAKDKIHRIHFPGVKQAHPTPGVLEAIKEAEAVIVAPSNPLVSIGPILAVPGLRDALRSTEAKIVAISPIVKGAALKGPADRMLRDVGLEASAKTIARLYRDFLDLFVIDKRDAGLEQEIHDLPGPDGKPGLDVIATDTIMKNRKAKAALARATLAAATGREWPR